MQYLFLSFFYQLFITLFSKLSQVYLVLSFFLTLNISMEIIIHYVLTFYQECKAMFDKLAFDFNFKAMFGKFGLDFEVLFFKKHFLIEI